MLVLQVVEIVDQRAPHAGSILTAQNLNSGILPIRVERVVGQHVGRRLAEVERDEHAPSFSRSDTMRPEADAPRRDVTHELAVRDAEPARSSGWTSTNGPGCSASRATAGGSSCPVCQCSSSAAGVEHQRVIRRRAARRAGANSQPARTCRARRRREARRRTGPPRRRRCSGSGQGQSLPGPAEVVVASGRVVGVSACQLGEDLLRRRRSHRIAEPASTRSQRTASRAGPRRAASSACRPICTRRSVLV